MLFAMYKKCFAPLLSPYTWKFTFTHFEDFFSLFQFLISFKLFTPIVWYSFPFIRPYFEFEKSNHSRLNLTDFFKYFWNMFWILSFSIFISMGFIFALSSKFCWPHMLIKSIVVILAFLFSQSLYGENYLFFGLLFQSFIP